MPPIADDIRQRATRIKLACFDVDGTLTDGRLFFDEQGRESKLSTCWTGKAWCCCAVVGLKWR